MFRHKFSLAVILILSWCSVSVASGLIPFKGNLEPHISEDFKLLQRGHSIDDAQALKLAYKLNIETISNQAKMPVRAWSLLVYTQILLETDSIAKAESLLSDSASIDWVKLDDWLRAYHSLNMGSILAFKGNYSEADKLFRSAIKMHDKVEDVLTINLNQALANNLRYQGKLDQSLIKWYKALRISEKQKDSAEIADSYLGKGVVRFLKDELDKAEHDIQVFYGFNIRINNQKKIAYGLSLLSLIDYRNGEYDISIKRNLKSYDIRVKINDLKGQGESLNNLALGYMGLKNWRQALRYLEEAIQLKTRANDHTQMTVILNNMGHCHKRLGNTTEALKYFKLALNKGKENGQMGDVVTSYGNIMKLHTLNKDFQLAFEIQSKLLRLKDSLATAERNEAISELEVKYGTEKKEQKIILLQQDKTIVTNRWLTLALGLFLIIITSILFIDNQKRKHRQEKQLLVKDDEIQKAELKRMADLLEYNQKKLSLYTENLLKKNELVGELEVRLKDAVQGSPDELEKGKKLIADFSAVRILTDDDWVEFKELFNGVHRGMLNRLLDIHENLTLGEQRLFLLMKLGLSTKEIANILGVSPESVKKGRYRLKKKIGIPEATSLQDFVSSF